VRRLVSTYRERSSALGESLAGRLGQSAGFVPADGGMFIWVELDGAALGRPDLDTTALLPAALSVGVAFVPGEAFALSSRAPSNGSASARQCLRLSFATETPQRLDVAIARLEEALAIREDPPFR
jgi:2-aminoadipate transaminase